MEQSQNKSPGSRPVGLFFFRSAQIKCNDGIDPYAKTNGDGIDKVLDRIDQG